MVRTRRKRRSDVYRTDLNRLSVYPQYRKPEMQGKITPVRKGEVLTVRITGLDDDGKPTGIVKGYTVIVEDAEVNPGEKVRVIIEDVQGKTLKARLARE